MHRFTPVRPLAAQVGLGGPAIGPAPAVERAVNPVLREKSARGNHLRAERFGGLPVHLTEKGRLPRPDQGLQPDLAGAAHDLDLEVPATGGAPPVVRGPARGADAWVGARVNRQLAGGPLRRRKSPGDRPPVLDDQEAVSSQTPGWPAPDRGGGRDGRVSVGPAPSTTVPILLEITARHLEHGVGEEVAVPPPEPAELDRKSVV